MSEAAETIAPPAPAQTVGLIDEVGLCQTVADYFSLRSRTAIAQLLAAQLDSLVLTPSELLHNHKALKALLAQHPLVEVAVGRVVALQGRRSGESIQGRREAIQNTIAAALEQAVLAERTLDSVAHKGPPFAVLQRDQGMRPGESREQDYLLLSAVCRELTAMRNWGLKLSFLVSLAGDDVSGRVAALVDGTIADLIAAGRVLNQLCGKPADAGVELRRLCDLALVEVQRPGDGGRTPLAGLNRLLRAGRLPETRTVILDRLRRLLRGGQPLGAGLREEEIRTFQEALTALVGPAGVAGGGAMAEALVLRYARRLDESSNTGLRQAMQGTIETLPGFFSRLHFLAALACSDLGQRAANELAMLVETLPNNETLVERTLFQPFDPVALAGDLKRAAAAFAVTPLPAGVRERLDERITGLVDTQVMRGNFIEGLDQAEPSLSRRIEAFRAVIAAGLVSEFGGRPLIEQHIARLTERPETIHPLADPTPVRDGQLVARFGRHRCPNCFEAKGGSGMCLTCGHDESEGPRPGVHLRAGAVLQSRYVVGRLIGQGGFGATYLGWDERLQVKVAIKEYFPVSLASRSSVSGALVPYTGDQVATFQDGISKFLAEARILARLRNVREIVEVHDFFEANATAYMVMELLVGRTLQRHLLEEGGAIDYRRALGLILPIAKAVHDVHQLGLVHRDISPDNIFLLDCGGAKLLDFGAARQCVGEATGNLTVILKRGYAPPEQYGSESRQGPWTDVYALAATFYCAITGKPPPDSNQRWLEETLVRPSKLGVSIPPAVEDALIAALALKWEERPRDMKTLLQALNRALL
ncbi:MAG: serine/threonine-protein kinase [Rhodospirillaceae bacterium]